ncbi:MAG: glycosyltransferase [Microcoleus sp.]
MPSLSVCMMVQNAEKTLTIALTSLANAYDELIIVDGGSTDKTCEIAAQYGARIIHSPWPGNHSQQRNIYLQEVKKDWVFVLDSDEFIDRKTLDFLERLRRQGSSTEIDRVSMPRKWISPISQNHYISSAPHFPDPQCRLFKFNPNLYYEGRIHENLYGFHGVGVILDGLTIYHLDLFINDEVKRQAKVRKYMKENPLDGAIHYYLPPLKNLKITEWNQEDICLEVKALLQKLSENNRQMSGLNHIIPPEIKSDEFYEAIKNIAKQENIKTILEIGSSSGEGSTEAFVTGIRDNPHHPQLFCMEISQVRFTELQKRYAKDYLVKCYNVSSVEIDRFAKEQEVINFYNSYKTALRKYPLDQILYWLRQDLQYLQNSGVYQEGIKKIKNENHIDYFDVVLIDGSEFTGAAELEEVYGAKLILLDDINTFKNYNNYHKLLKDPNYKIVAQSFSIRHGYAIFRKLDFALAGASDSPDNYHGKEKNSKMIANTGCQDAIKGTICVADTNPLIVHFFTIVINGEPFIRYHIDIFKELPFKWHWHIVEGIADLKYDTGWSIKMGGCIPDEIHHNSRSNDGTTEYLDKLAELYPENVTIYRKPEGVFWDGKREMVNEPLVYGIREECLLWQIDADELWTFEQICKTRQMFIEHPEKTAAFYWCWYFVGENLVISTRNCYANNPQYEWLRTWRFKPGMVWATHEPPRLAEPLPNGKWRDVASINPFHHQETEKQGLIFQHFSYVTPNQLRFKEQYYGYKNATSQWLNLQQQTQFPVLLRQYFDWVKDDTEVNSAIACGVEPLAQRDITTETWQFKTVSPLPALSVKHSQKYPTILIDGVFFQENNTGIARVWKSLWEEWANTNFAQHIIILDRNGTAPKIPGIRYRTIPLYDYGNTDRDRTMLQQICDEETADLFISTYYTTPLSTRSVFMAYDMIPELIGQQLDQVVWREKHYAIRHASAFITISQNTSHDLLRCFPQISPDTITVAHCGINQIFSPTNSAELQQFCTKYNITKPYFIFVGERVGWYAYKNPMLFLQAFKELANKANFEIVCVGGKPQLEKEFMEYTSGVKVQILQLEDSELKKAYSGAIALIYPSKYEGFGLPVVEAMACGCPVITCPKASLPEVAGKAALYVGENDVNGMKEALLNVQKTDIRQSLIQAGLAQCQQFSWSKMATIVSSVLLQTACKTSEEVKVKEWMKHLGGGEAPQSPAPSTITSNVETLSTGFPKIHPVASNLPRPFWSVMIPTYNRVKYLEQALKSVLQQIPNSEEMQIEVVNDCSNQSIQYEMEALVKNIGGGRVNFYRHPEQDVGQTAIFNLCIERAQGEWVHILHDDDVVLPGFYSSLRTGIEKESSVGAAFCRHIYTDEVGNQRWVSWLERETPGVLTDWLEQIIVMCRLQASPIVVKRSVYEKLGGFSPQAGAASDWEMWKRIAVHYPIWYEPQPLAWYRQHSSSDNTRLVKSGGLIADVRRSIEISKSYLLREVADKLSNQAREHYAFYALDTAKKLLTDGEFEGAIAQIRESLKCSQSSQVKEAIVSLLLQGESHQPSTGFSSAINRSQTEATNPSISVDTKPTRKQIADTWLNLPPAQLAISYAGDTGKLHQALLNSEIKDESLTHAEQTFVNELAANIAKGFNDPKAINYLLAAMLYRRADQLPLKYDRAQIPNWFANEYLKFMFASPNLFQTVGEADNYYQYIQGWVNYIHSNIFKNPDAKLWQNIAFFFSQVANFIPLYFTTENLRDLYTKRADIIEFALKSRGSSIDCIFPGRSPNRTKIRLGIINDHFTPQTETFATIPVFEHLNRNQFEIILYALNTNGHQLEQYCQSRADKLVTLPTDFATQVQTIRADDLDILFFGTNLTAVNKPLVSLAMHRLARVQTTSFCSPTTTGIRHMDYYIAGNFTVPDATYQEQYREQLATLEGSGFCFKYATESEVATVKPTRKSLGIDDKTTVFISGANFYKILPELRETWVKILASVPNSILILYPFGPAWTRSYPITPFVNNLNAVCAKYGVNNNRLRFVKQLPSRADVKEFLQLADVYLDSYPYAGATSLIDPLQVGLPTVVVEGNALRFRQGSAMLRELQMPDLITNSEASYIQLAVTLATNPELRQRYRQEIQQKMQANPACFDSVAYSGAIAKLFQQLFGKWQTGHQAASRILQDSIPKPADLGDRLLNTVKLYQANSSNISAILQLRQIRKQIADFWLNVSVENLENAYKGDSGKSYQILLASGFQHQPMMEDEQRFLQQLTQISKGLVHPKALNALLAAMLYFPPGTMRIPDARNRLPQWLIGDYEQVFEAENAVNSESTSELLAQYIQSPQFVNQLLGCVNLYRIDSSDASVVLELRQIRKQLADFWLTVPPEKLETFYQGEVRKGYQAILKSGLQAESMTDAEQKFLEQLTEISKGLVHPQAINALLGAMLYFVPGKMRVPDANTRLPKWLIDDYEKVFESALAQTEQTLVKQDYLPQFLNQLTAGINLYKIDPTAELVIADLRQIRQQISDLWVSVSEEQLEVLYRSDFGKGYKAMLASGFINEPLNETERAVFNSLVAELSKGFGRPKAVNYLLAAMLFCRAGQLRVEDANTCLPEWLLTDYDQFVGASIQVAVK